MISSRQTRRVLLLTLVLLILLFSPLLLVMLFPPVRVVLQLGLIVLILLFGALRVARKDVAVKEGRLVDGRIEAHEKWGRRQG